MLREDGTEYTYEELLQMKILLQQIETARLPYNIFIHRMALYGLLNRQPI